MACRCHRRWINCSRLDFSATRREKARRNLDIVAIVAFLVVALQLEPARGSARGIDLGKNDQTGVLWALFAFDLAFLALFLLYATSDMTRLNVRLIQLDSEITQLEQQGNLALTTSTKRLQLAHSASDPQRNQLATEIESQVAHLAGVLVRLRALEMFRALGVLRFLAEFALPVLLAVAAAIALVLRID
jgi:hypothetical protein